jgi:hypothetical protein
MGYNETPTKGKPMTANFETQDKSVIRKTAQTTQDALTVIALGMAAYGLGKLAYDTTKFGIQKFKERKNQK